MRIATIESVVDNSFGGKAYGLSLLKSNGFLIPDTFCIAPIQSLEEIGAEFKRELIAFLGERKNYHFAVRSSSLVEDMASESKAGHYLTIIDDFDIDSLIGAIKQVFQSGEKMGVVLQEAIDADYSGVFFSSNPNTFSKKNGILSYVSGMGDKLLNGNRTGVDVEICFENYDNPQFKDVVFQVKSLEDTLEYPIDVEWCVKDNQFYYLQCRPITSITSIKSGLYKVDPKQELPQQIIYHDKIQLRYEASQTGVFVSDAYVHVYNTSISQGIKNMFENIKDLNLKASKYCKGYSVVVIYPQRISDKVIRSFVGSNWSLSQGIGRCYRYGVRSYPEYKDMEACLQTFHEKASEDYWISATIIQEVFDATYTGVIQRSNNGFIIEVTKGHFLTKGHVLTSQYFADENSVLSRNDVHQQIWYRIVQGHVIECECNNEKNNLVSLSDEQVTDIVRSFSSIIGNGNRVVEFGMISYGRDLKPYLIDFVDSEIDSGILESDIEDGIISRGKRRGIIRRIEENSDNFDKHFLDVISGGEQISEEIIFLCKTPSIALLDLISKYENSKISFAFEEGSILCHFAVILRENGIPAVKTGEIDIIKEGWYILDAESKGIRGKERLRHESYSNIISES